MLPLHAQTKVHTNAQMHSPPPPPEILIYHYHTRTAIHISAEQNASALVKQLVDSQSSARRTEDLLEALERERREAEEWWLVRAEEVEQLRRKEVLEAMERVLAQNRAMDELIGGYFTDRENVVKAAKKQ